MSQKKFEIIIQATGKGVKSTFTTATQGMRAFNKEVGKGNSVISSLKGQIAGLAGAYVGFNAITGVKDIMAGATTSAYNLETSLQAANREFDNVGSADSWGAAIDRIRENLRIYSKADIKNATARTVDMTKRLGMSADQMERIIVLSGDLSAGKTTLEGGIERVTAALRGEAEASEYLGLTLNETYVKAWHEAHNASGQAWKDLTDLEKAQVRYNVFLEQALPLQGKAGDSIKTFAGAVAAAKADVNDAFAENDDLIKATGELSKVITENADAIGDTAAKVATAAGNFLQWAVQNRELIATLGKGTILIWGVGKAISSVYTTIRGINAALLVMTGMNISGWFRGLGQAAMVARSGVVALAGTSVGLGATLLALPAAAGFAAVSVAKLVNQYLELKKIEVETAAQEKENTAAVTGLAAEFADLSAKTGVVIKSREDLTKAIKEGKIHYNDATGEWIAGAKTMAVATTQSASTIKQVTGDALEDMKKKYKKYFNEIKKLEEQRVSHAESVQDQLRNLARTGMSDIGAWKDRKREAEEYEDAAKKAVKSGNYEAAVGWADKARAAYADLNNEVKISTRELIANKKAQAQEMMASGWSKGSYQEYLAIQKEIAGLQAKLAKEGKESQSVAVTGNAALKTALEGVESSGKIAAEAMKKQQDAAHAAMEELTEKSGFQDLTKGMDQAERDWINNWQTMRKKAILDIEAVEDRLLKIKNKEITVWINEKVAKAMGGLVGSSQALRLGGAVMMAGGGFLNFLGGGHLPGFGGGDRRHIVGEDGEVMIKKESVREAGLRAALAFNAGNWPLVMKELASKFAFKMQLGGAVGRFSLPPMPALAMQSGGAVSAPSMGHYTHDINFQGAAAPVRVMTDRQNTAAFINGLKRMQELAS